MNAIDLTTLNGQELVSYYNQISGKSIKKFDSKAKGVARIEKFLAENPQPESGRKNTAGDAERTGKILNLLRKKECAISEMRQMFGTSYKNITGSLFDIRNGRGVELAEDEELVRRRDGMVSYYSIRKVDDAE